jgi:hypothetical protein
VDDGSARRSVAPGADDDPPASLPAVSAPTPALQEPEPGPEPRDDAGARPRLLSLPTLTADGSGQPVPAEGMPPAHPARESSDPSRDASTTSAPPNAATSTRTPLVRVLLTAVIALAVATVFALTR